MPAVPAIVLDHVEKVHPLRSGRARSMKQALLGLFRGRAKEETVRAIDGLTLTVPKGKSLGVVGVNGAGKSSLLRLIAGISEPSSGRVAVDGRVLPMLELGAGFHPDLSGYENILLQGILSGIPRSRVLEMVPSIIGFAEINDSIHMPVKHYSSGMYLRLGFAISAHMNPDILLIDEAFSVGDAYFQEKCFRKILEFRNEGKTILLVTHDISIVDRLCDEVVWIDKGRIVGQGRPAEIANQYNEAVFLASFARPIPMTFDEQVTISKGRYGSGRALFEYVELRNGHGERSNAFENGQPMEIILRYRLQSRLERADFRLFIQSYRGQGAACIDTHEMGKPVRLYSPAGEVRFRMDNLALAPGRYQMSALLHEGSSHDVRDFYDFHLRLYDFYVISRRGLSESAALDFPVHWEHHPRGSDGALGDLSV